MKKLASWFKGSSSSVKSIYFTIIGLVQEQANLRGLRGGRVCRDGQAPGDLAVGVAVHTAGKTG